MISSPGWDLILTYLTLADLENVSRTNSKLNKIVGSYLGRGSILTIDRDSVFKYPIASNRNMYANYGSLATDIVIDRVFKFDFIPLLGFLSNAQKLTIKNVTINGDGRVNYPPHLTTLRLINTSVGWLELEQLIHLETLLVQESEIPIVVVKSPCLKSLTLIGTGISMTHALPKLTELTVDYWPRVPCETI